MAVADLFTGGGAHADDLEGKAQVTPGQRVVTVQQHGVALDLHDVEDMLGALVGSCGYPAGGLTDGFHVGAAFNLGTAVSAAAVPPSTVDR